MLFHNMDLPAFGWNSVDIWRDVIESEGDAMLCNTLKLIFCPYRKNPSLINPPELIYTPQGNNVYLFEGQKVHSKRYIQQSGITLWTLTGEVKNTFFIIALFSVWEHMKYLEAGKMGRCMDSNESDIGPNCDGQTPGKEHLQNCSNWFVVVSIYKSGLRKGQWWTSDRVMGQPRLTGACVEPRLNYPRPIQQTSYCSSKKSSIW